jgi:hypothetical protein
MSNRKSRKLRQQGFNDSEALLYNFKTSIALNFAVFKFKDSVSSSFEMVARNALTIAVTHNCINYSLVVSRSELYNISRARTSGL